MNIMKGEKKNFSILFEISIFMKNFLLSKFCVLFFLIRSFFAAWAIFNILHGNLKKEKGHFQFITNFCFLSEQFVVYYREIGKKVFQNYINEKKKNFLNKKVCLYCVGNFCIFWIPLKCVAH